jgi:hypothetical protein
MMIMILALIKAVLSAIMNVAERSNKVGKPERQRGTTMIRESRPAGLVGVGDASDDDDDDE